MSGISTATRTTTTARKGISVQAKGKVIDPKVVAMSKSYDSAPTWMLEELRDGLAQSKNSWNITKVNFEGVAKSQLKKEQILSLDGGKTKDRYNTLVSLGNKHEVAYTRVLNKFLGIQQALAAADYALTQRKNRDASRLGNGTANLA